MASEVGRSRVPPQEVAPVVDSFEHIGLLFTEGLDKNSMVYRKIWEIVDLTYTTQKNGCVIGFIFSVLAMNEGAGRFNPVLFMTGMLGIVLSTLKYAKCLHDYSNKPLLSADKQRLINCIQAVMGALNLDSARVLTKFPD